MSLAWLQPTLVVPVIIPTRLIHMEESIMRVRFTTTALILGITISSTTSAMALSANEIDQHLVESGRPSWCSVAAADLAKTGRWNARYEVCVPLWAVSGRADDVAVPASREQAAPRCQGLAEALRQGERVNGAWLRTCVNAVWGGQPR